MGDFLPQGKELAQKQEEFVKQVLAQKK